MLTQLSLKWLFFYLGIPKKFQEHDILTFRLLQVNNQDLIHQSIPAAPSAPRALAIFLPWMANSRGWGLLSCQIPRGGDANRGQMSRPP